MFAQSARCSVWQQSEGVRLCYIGETNNNISPYVSLPSLCIVAKTKQKWTAILRKITADRTVIDVVLSISQVEASTRVTRPTADGLLLGQHYIGYHTTLWKTPPKSISSFRREVVEKKMDNTFFWIASSPMPSFHCAYYGLISICQYIFRGYEWWLFYTVRVNSSGQWRWDQYTWSLRVYKYDQGQSQ